MAHRSGATGDLRLTQPLSRRWLLLIVLLPWGALAAVLVGLRIPVALESSVYQSGQLADGQGVVALRLPVAEAAGVAVGDLARIAGVEGGTLRKVGEGRVIHRGAAQRGSGGHAACDGLAEGKALGEALEETREETRGEAQCVVIALMAGRVPGAPSGCAGHRPWPKLRVEMPGQAMNVLDLLKRKLR